MNTNPDSDTTVPPPPAGGFFAWIRNLGIERSSERWFAGVAGGIAAKANIDPLIVRGVFVVLALLGGPGILLYLVGWLLLPDVQGRIHVEEIIRGRAQTGVLITAIVLAAVVCIPVIIGFVSAPPLTIWGWDAWSVMGMPDWLSATIAWVCWIAILVFGGIWLRRVLLERGRKQAAAAAGEAGATGATSAAAAADTAAADAAGAAERSWAAPTTGAAAATGAAATAGAAGSASAAGSAGSDRATADPAGAPTTDHPEPGPVGSSDDWAQRANQWGERAGAAADRWGEQLGSQADEWTARYAEHHDAHRLGAAHTIITIALALLVGGVTALWVSTSGALSDVATSGSAAGHPTPVAIIAALVAALAVLAVSIIVAGVRGRHTGMIGFLAACGVVALLFAAVLPWGTRFQPFGTLEVTGVQEPGAVLLAGNARIDLSDLDRTGVPAVSGSNTSASNTSASNASASNTSGSNSSGSNSSGSTAPEGGADLVVWQLTGNATVTLPAEHPTSVTVYMLAGNIGEQWGEETRNSAGPFLSKRVTANLDGRSASDAEVAHVEVFMLAGNARVVGSAEDSGLTEEARRNIEADTAGDGLSDAATLREQQSLETELDRLDWQLAEPGLTSADRRALEADRVAVERALERLEPEVSR